MSEVIIRPVNELDISSIEGIDEKITGQYRPGHWEQQVQYYVSRDNESALVAAAGDEVVGFMFGDIRGWEFGFEKPTGWIEVVGVSPDHQGKQIARKLTDALLGRWREAKVESARTLVNNSDEQIAGFMQHIGMQPSPMTAYEMSL